jgi:dTDP-glucose 4,6-dehydratase
VKRILITGGAGFIGSHFVRRFLKTHPDWQVTNFDKLTYAGNPENLRDVEKNPRYRFVKGDVCDLLALEKVCQEMDAVIHFAAETHVDRSIEDDRDFLRTNIWGTHNLLEMVRRFKISRYVHISTDEVYGSIERGDASEDFPLAPNSPYAASKAAGDLLVRAYQKTYRIPALILRSSNNFGPYQYPEKVIPLFITNLLEKKKVPLYARGENRRDWIYVEDNCEAIEALFDRGEPGQIYNVGGGNEMSNRELTLKLLAQFSLSEDWIESVPDRPGHDFRYALDCSKIRKMGIRPRHSFDQALTETVAWYREHPEWWQPLRKDKFTVKG